ncbi:MAG: energy transducer TonB [Bacteroidales bacterium]|nr:energy transducer TonB [Bacteroidales bacterium]
MSTSVPSSSGLSRMALFAIVLAALFLTCITLFLLPALDALSGKTVEKVEYRPVNTVELPQQLEPKLPVEPPMKKPAELSAQEHVMRKPRLEQEKPRLPKPQLTVRHDVAFESPSLELALGFQVDPNEQPLPTLVETQVQKDDAIVVTPAKIAENANTNEIKEGIADGSGLIFDSDEVDVAPQPISCPRPQFPYRAKMRGVSGKVRVAFTVLENGLVENVEVIAAEPSGFFEEAALDAVRKWRFSPGKKQGKPVSTMMKSTIDFLLVDE